MDSLAVELAAWMVERDRVRQVKELGLPKPWSADPIMRTTRFTNVRREDDRVTKWVATFWRDPYWDSPNLIPALIIARMVNRPETLDRVGFPFKWGEDWESHFLNIMCTPWPGPIWGNAYMITTCGEKMAKEDYVLRVANAVRKRLPEPPLMNLSRLHAWLTISNGMGSFLAAQVVADLKNTPGTSWSRAEDFHTFVASGPGSRKGLNYYFLRDPDTNYPEIKFRREILVAWDQVKPLLPKPLQDVHMQDFQNCFCEFSKYMRIKNGGRAKNRYPG